MAVKCVCGSTKYKKVNRPHWTVSAEGVTEKARDRKIKFAQCNRCGVIRQTGLPFKTDEEYANYYSMEYPPTTEAYGVKGYVHDLRVAELRCNDYGISPGAEDKILDIGSGSGAFVDECRKRGAQAYGCEIAEYADGSDNSFIYQGQFEKLNFPTDHFDKVTCHDVLEHVLDPLQMVREMFRTTKQGGTCIIDVPRFHHAAGEHHWKAVEHIWFFTTEQLKRLLERVGFVVTDIKNPIESKEVFYCVKPGQDRPSILVPPGIGDSYWSIIKMEAFLKREKLGLPDVHVVCPREKKYQGHRRSIPFIELFPFLNCSGKVLGGDRDPNLRPLWQEAYAKQGRTIFTNVLDCDYFLSYNGHLRFGAEMEELDPDLKTDWLTPMFKSLEQENFRLDCLDKYGKYNLFYFVFHGTYKYWTQQFPVQQVIECVNKITEQTGHVPIFTGAKWDAEERALNKVVECVPNAVDLRGKTTVDQVFGLIRGSELFVGYPSGLTIMGAVFGAKTLIIWNTYYNMDFAWFCAPPTTRGENYFIEFTKGLTAEKLVETSVNILEGIQPPEMVLPEPRERRKRITARQQAQGVTREKEDAAPLRQTREVPAGPPTVVCVLKSGGVFGTDYVQRLFNMLSRHVTIPFQFVCLTDVGIPKTVCPTLPLKRGWQGSWSKVEMFKEGLLAPGRIVYFDLDTIILDNIDDILRVDYDFIGLRPWNKNNRGDGMLASGMMSWTNDGHYTFIYDRFSLEMIQKHPAGDQHWISNQLRAQGKEYGYFQDTVTGVYSYKRDCRPSSLPPDARIVCFHGKPRPHECDAEWVKEHWR